MSNSLLEMAAFYTRGGLTVTDICEQTYYRWQRKLYGIVKAQQEQSRFAEITPARVCSGKAAVTVRIAGTEVDIHSGADEETVGMVLRLLKSC